MRWPPDDPRGKLPEPAFLLVGFWMVVMSAVWLFPNVTAPVWGRVGISLWVSLVCGLGAVGSHFKLRRELRDLRRERGLCLKCGYDLRGSADRCPECGAPVEAKP